MHNDIHAPLVTAQQKVEKAEDACQQLDARIPLGVARLGQQVLNQEMKRFTHIIRTAAFNTSVTPGLGDSPQYGLQAAEREAHNLVRQVFKQSGDIDPTIPGYLSITLDPMPTRRETTAVKELCESLTELQSRYRGTDLILRFGIKERL